MIHVLKVWVSLVNLHNENALSYGFAKCYEHDWSIYQYISEYICHSIKTDFSVFKYVGTLVFLIWKSLFKIFKVGGFLYL